MQLTTTWQTRLRRSRIGVRRAGSATLAVLAVAGGAAAWRVFIAAEQPDIAGIAAQVGNSADQVGSFAADFVVAWLTATTSCQQPATGARTGDSSCRDSERAVLQRFITVPDGAAPLPLTPAAVVTIPQPVSVIATGSVGQAKLYTAVVAVTERPYASAQPTRAFYQVPVSVWQFQPRALAMPARINGPGPGADVALGYRQPLSPDSAVAAVVRGFLSTYLTASTGLDRYVRAGAPLSPVGGYQSAVVTAAFTAETIPDDPAPDAQIHVLATVVAQTSQFATITMSYPLRVENAAGTWMIAGLDLAPALADTDPEPLPDTQTPG